MNQLSKYLFILGLIFLISLGLFLGTIYLREAQNFHLFNASSLRLLTFIGFVVATGFLFGSALVTWIRPLWSQKALLVFERLIQRNWLHKSIFFLSVLTIVFLTIPLWNIFIGGDARYQPILIRFSPIVFLLGSLSLIVVRSKYFIADQKKWVKLVLISSLCFGVGILLQSILINKLEHPLSASIRIQFAYALVCLIFSITFISQKKYDSYLLLLLEVLMVVLFVVQWVVFPHKLRRMLPVIFLYAPIIMVSMPLIALFLMGLWKWLREKTQENIVWIVKGLMILSLFFLAIIYYQAASKHSNEINIDLTVSDQSAYMSLIKEARRLDFNYTGDHNRMPLYPFFQALFYSLDMDDSALFEQGKEYNLILSIVLLIILFIVLLRLFGLFRSYLLVIIIGFSIFIFKAPYVQAEILYYSLSALSFVLMLMMLTRPTWLRSIATGIIVGLAYLTKGTILSSLPLFTLLYSVQLVLFGVQEKINHNKERLKIFTQKAAHLLVVLVLFAVVIFPYAQALKQRFGHYFYNVNTTFYIWFDDWQMAVEEEAKHNFVDQWPSHLTDDELPNLRNYLREHSFQQISDRFVSGFEGQFRNIFNRPFSVTNYWISYLVILMVGILSNFDQFRKFVKSNWVPVLFVMLYFTGYLSAFAWYDPIADGRRFTYAVYIPFLIAVFLVMRELIKNQTRDPDMVENEINLAKYFSASHLIIAMSLIFNIWLVTNNVLFIDAYGS